MLRLLCSHPASHSILNNLSYTRPTLMMMASALQCLRGRLAASAVPAALLPIASALNRGGRGFAAAPAAGGSGGSPPPPPQEGVDSKQAQQQDGKQPKQQDVQQQQQRHQHSSEDPGVPAASAGSSPPTSEAPPFASGAGGGGGGHHPDLHKYIASLASLKGGWGSCVRGWDAILDASLLLLITVEHAGACRVHHGAAAGDGGRRQVVADDPIVHRRSLASGLD